jgi:hypothetical protein
VNVTFRCYADDANNDNQPDASFLPTACNVTPGTIQAFTCSGGRCFALCVPSEGDTCNVVVVASGKGVPYGFGQAINIPKGNTGTITSAACRGGCGGAPATPMDVVIILDRTGSMSNADLDRVKAATRSLLQNTFNPSLHRVAIGLLGPSSRTSTSPCAGGANGRAGSNPYGNPNGVTWIASPFTSMNQAPLSDYQPSPGTLDNSSDLVRLLAGASGANGTCINSSSVGTDLGTPIDQARQYLNAFNLPGRDKGIILLTDGAANEPQSASGQRECQYANTNATTAKNANINIVTIGFGVADEVCADQSPSRYRAGAPPNNPAVTQLLADMASPINGVAADDNLGCTAAENADGDNFFCQPFGADLTTVFARAAGQLTGKPRLLNLP